MSRIETIAEGVTVYLGDCREILPTLGKVDAIVTDPPYGIKEAAGKNKSRGLLAVSKDYGDLDWDNAPPPAWLVAMLRDISRYQIIFGGNYYDLPPSSCWLVWDKKNGNTDFADCELAWTNLPKAVRKIEWLWHGMIRKGSDVREHPTQKPLGVMAFALDQLPADVKQVCDPFMGSGTTGVAAIQKGLQFVGIEREAAYFDPACQRLVEALNAPKLFSAPLAVPVQAGFDYDAKDDMAKSIDACYEAVRERVAAGGPEWDPDKPPAALNIQQRAEK